MENDILTLEDVAKYLRIAERTVYAWAQKGKLPGGKLGTSWRFKRTDIARWVDEQLGADTVTQDATIELRDILTPERTLILDKTTKQDAFTALLNSLTGLPEITVSGELHDEIFRREQLLSTGIGRGTGVPHVRLDSVSGIVMSTGICRTPLSDYESIDGKPVSIIFMIAAPGNRHKSYLQALARISTLIKNEKFRLALAGAPDTATAYGLITSHL